MIPNFTVPNFHYPIPHTPPHTLTSSAAAAGSSVGVSSTTGAAAASSAGAAAAGASSGFSSYSVQWLQWRTKRRYGQEEREREKE